ncbi:MAG: sulfatase-like hydrolase/transferase [Bacteroidales bacterium]|jgi:phosphoglycerol transferase MdoB-like AlkP superfamily enzyme|nr:sulfatase-like hydrolase/transferase [Bacteroidales bacterium]
MKKIIIAFGKQLLFWILFFNLVRLAFILYYLKIILVEKIQFTEVIDVFYYSFKLDLATACYFMLIPYLLLAVQSIWSPRWINWINNIYTSFLIIVYSLSVAAEMGIYAEWKTKLTYKVIKYLSHPSEIYNSAETGTFYFLVFLFLLMSLTGIMAYLKLFYMELVNVRKNLWFSICFVILTPSLLFLGMRGGIQQIPINQSESYYSDHNILNISAVNNAFNLYISIFENLQNFNHDPYVFMDQKSADRIMSGIYRTPKDSTIQILNVRRPNIVLLILESWSADLIEDLGGKPGITPEFKKLQKQGILFDQIYASGSRSEQGMASIFGGFPAHPVSSITVQPDKFVKLPSLIRDLELNGYNSSYYFGGQLIYGNIKGYIIFNGFDKIMEVYDFPETMPRGKLGIHDQFTLDYMVNDLSKKKQPFVTALFTLSTHSPWDQPFQKPLKWGDNEHEYINAAYYTDHCLGDFFAKAQKQPWFDSTLFIIVADHSHNSYRNWHPESREYHKIPLLFFGSVIKEKYRGTIIHKLGNQHDLASTLLTQLDIPAKEFRYSKNLLNPYTPDFAYYSTEDGVGWIRPNGYFTYDKGPDFYYWWTDPKLSDSIRKEGKAYLQTVFRDYMDK